MIVNRNMWKPKSIVNSSVITISPQHQATPKWNFPQPLNYTKLDVHITYPCNGNTWNQLLKYLSVSYRITNHVHLAQQDLPKIGNWTSQHSKTHSLPSTKHNKLARPLICESINLDLSYTIWSVPYFHMQKLSKLQS